MHDPLLPELDLVAALRLTSPPPVDWIEAAALLPSTLGDLERLERTIDSPEFRARFRVEPEQAVQEAGLKPSASLLGALRDRLEDV